MKPDRSILPTDQELQAIRAVVKWGTMPPAARELHLSHHTVKTYLDRLRKKAGLHTNLQLAALAGMNGWLGGVWQEETSEKSPDWGTQG